MKQVEIKPLETNDKEIRDKDSLLGVWYLVEGSEQSAWINTDIGFRIDPIRGFARVIVSTGVSYHFFDECAMSHEQSSIILIACKTARFEFAVRDNGDVLCKESPVLDRAEGDMLLGAGSIFRRTSSDMGQLADQMILSIESSRRR